MDRVRVPGEDQESDDEAYNEGRSRTKPEKVLGAER